MADASEIARLLVAAPRPLLVGLDIDGTLSDIVPHADQARLVDGALAAVQVLQRLPGVHVVLVTGRGRDDARRTFGIPDDLPLVGSHGRELHGGGGEPDVAARRALDALEADARALADGLDGAWVERKPFSVALHVRQADPERGEHALAALEREAAEAGATTLRGSAVVEVGHGPLDKGAAIEHLRAELGAAAVCFVGDDVTDEKVFARLVEGDVAVKVGEAPSLAPHRLAGPRDVVELLVALSRGT